VNKQILSLVNTFQHQSLMTLNEFTELLAACSAWLKLTDDNKLDKLQAYSGKATKEKLSEVLNNNVDVHFTSRKWQLTDEKLSELLHSMRQLLSAQAISYKDLSISINQLIDDAGKKTGSISIPDELCQLGVSLLGNQIGSVYCPYSNGNNFAIHLPKTSEKYGESSNGSDVFNASVHNILLDNNFHIVNSDPISSPHYMGDNGLKQFTSSVAMPPFNVNDKYKNINDIWDRFPEKSLMSDVYFLRHMLAQTENIVVCFVVNGFLFRTAAGEKQFKQDVLNRQWIKAVIALPENLLSNTRIPISIMVLDKNKTGSTVNFIDASTEQFINKTSRTRNQLINVDEIILAYNSAEDTSFSEHSSIENIVENDYNLSPSRYVRSEEHRQLIKEFIASNPPTAKLADLVDIIRPQALKDDGTGDLLFREYNVSAINPIGELSGEGKILQVGNNEINRAAKQTIEPNDVLVVCKGAVGKVAIVGNTIPSSCSEIWGSIASQAFAILRIKAHVDTITSEALYQYLISGYGQYHLKTLTTGTSARMLAAKDLNTLEVPLFTTEKLNNIKEIRQQVIVKHKKIERLYEEIASLNDSWQ
jgi:type I restriction enzyme M protein